MKNSIETTIRNFVEEYSDILPNRNEMDLGQAWNLYQEYVSEMDLGIRVKKSTFATKLKEILS